MTLLQEITKSAVDSSAPIADLLRRCLVLAHHLNNAELKAWAESELNGYPKGAEIPTYRRLSVHSKATLSGPWGSGARNVGIPAGNLPKHMRHLVSECPVHQSIASLEDMLHSKKTGYVVPLSADVVNSSEFRGVFDPMYNPVEAWQSISRGQVVSIVDSVRNRVLEFALLIQSEYPNIETTGVPAEKVASVNHSVTTIIHGSVANLAVGSTQVAQVTEVSVIHNDLESLRAFLDGIGVSAADFKELEVAITNDKAPPPDGLGKKVGAWVGKMTTKALAGGLKVAGSTATSEIIKALMAYYRGGP